MSTSRTSSVNSRLADPLLKISLNCNTIKHGYYGLSDAVGQQWETCDKSFTQESSPSPPPTERLSSATHYAQEENRGTNGQHSLLAIPLILKCKDFKCFSQKKFLTFKLRNFIQIQKGKYYRCDDCKKFFHQKSSLARHLKMNNIENRHKCGCCKKSFYTTMKYCKHYKLSAN